MGVPTASYSRSAADLTNVIATVSVPLPYGFAAFSVAPAEASSDDGLVVLSGLRVMMWQRFSSPPP